MDTCFGRWRLSPTSRRLFADGTPVTLGGRAFDLLLALVEAKGEIVTKEALMRRVWPGTIVDDNSLQVQISALRKALGQDAALLITTVPRRGYCFTCKWQWLEPGATIAKTEETPGTPSERPSPIVLPFRSLGDETGQAANRPMLVVLPSENIGGDPEQRYLASGVTADLITDPTLTLPDKPSIAVLPFQNTNGDAGQDYFVDGMTEEIITALSHVPSFFVVARHSTFPYKGTSPNIRQIGRELGVRYVLEGSVRKAGERVRITCQLIDASTGMHVWADRFDGIQTDIFELQDQVASSVVGAIEPKLRDAEIERARLKPTKDLRAYELVLRSRFASELRTREGMEEAIRLLRRAVDIDPHYPLATALLAFSSFQSAANHRTTPTEAELDGYVQLARDAIQRSSDDPEVLVPAAHVIALPGGDFPGATAFTDHACVLNSNSTEAWAASGLLRAYMGEIETAIQHLERSRRLNPRATLFQHVGFALAHFVDGRYDEAVNWTTAGLGRLATHVPLLRYRASSLGLLGRIEEARQVAQRMLALVPDLTIARARRHVEIEMKNPYNKPGVAEAYYEGLRRAGLPEG